MFCYTRGMAPSKRQLIDSLSRMPFVETLELASILGEPTTSVHRGLIELLSGGIAARVSHGTSQLPSSHRYYLTARGIGEAVGILGFRTPSDFVHAYPVSREWLALLIRRMDAVASIYRLAATLSPGEARLHTHVEFHRRGCLDATITLPDGRWVGVVRQGPALRRRSLNDRLRAIAGFDYSRYPDTVLILTPSAWEQGLASRFCKDRRMNDAYVAVESRETLERRDLQVWRESSRLFGGHYFTLKTLCPQGDPKAGTPRTESTERKRASIPDPERMVKAAPTFGITPAEKRALDLVTDHPMIPRQHLALWLGVSEGRVSQMMRSLVDTWRLVQCRGKRGRRRYTLGAEGIRYVTHRDRAQLPTNRGIWSTCVTRDRRGRPRYVGHRIDTWRRQTKHTDGITWFLSKLATEARDAPDSELLWSVPTAKTDRAFNWGRAAIAPDAVGKMLAGNLEVPFYLEYELRTRYPRGVTRRLKPYMRYYWSNAPEKDQPPFPTTLFVVDTHEVEETFRNTAGAMSQMTHPILVSCRPALQVEGILGRSWYPLWERASTRLRLSELRAYRWDSLRHRMISARVRDAA